MSSFLLNATRSISRYAHITAKPRARLFAYFRTSKEKMKSLRDYDDGYHYRNGEEHYAQTLRNKQEDALKFDGFYKRLEERSKRVYSKTWSDYPNCECSEEMKLEAMEKKMKDAAFEAKTSVPETAPSD